MSRMFLIDGKPMRTWNPFTGCNFHCTYCWARSLAEGRLKNAPRYRGGFVPHFNPDELRRAFKPDDFVFVSAMGDISFANPIMVKLILAKVVQFSTTSFLFCTKNPQCYSNWGLAYPFNLYLGATIESNADWGLTKAPPPKARYEAMVALEHDKKFVSIEPVLDFHLSTMVGWMGKIKPAIIEVGADNYHNNLPEPPGVSRLQEPWKVRGLLEELKQLCPTVVEKPGLERLTGIS